MSIQMKEIIQALKNNTCTFENMSKLYTKEALRVNICRLRKRGYNIESIENVGYKLKKEV